MSRKALRRTGGWAAILACAFCSFRVHAQDGTGERVFPQSKSTVESALKAMQANLAGHLPVLDGFATSEHPFEQYQRGYYQANAQVAETPSGGAWVRVTVKITAWYSDPSGSHSGYQLLKSNGRLEADLMDQLGEQLALNSKPARSESTPKAAKQNAEPAPVAQPPAPAPTVKFPEPGRFSSSDSKTLAPESFKAEMNTAEKAVPDPSRSSLQAEADGLEEILKNQAHPKNLVAVKKSGTPVVGNPSLSAKPLFLASMHDEFEILDFNEDWVHVRISGLSRGWIWRNSVEMPEGIPDTASHSASAATAADLFHVTREEDAQFPGDWAPLRGKNVKIISVQKVDDKAKGGGPEDKLEYAKYLLEKNAAELSRKTQELSGIVLIFDSSDGGMIAASAATVQQWKSGSLSDSALWHNCFFDPPETFTTSAPSGTQ